MWYTSRAQPSSLSKFTHSVVSSKDCEDKVKRSRRNCEEKDKSFKVAFLHGHPQEMCVLPQPLHQGLQGQANKSYNPHSTCHFHRYHSGLEFEEKGCIPGSVSGIKKTSGLTGVQPWLLHRADCRGPGLPGVERSPPLQRLPRKGSPISHMPEHLSEACS